MNEGGPNQEKKKTRTIFANDARPGMILTANVPDPLSNDIFIPAGHELDEESLETFRTWGVSVIEVEDYSK